MGRGDGGGRFSNPALDIATVAQPTPPARAAVVATQPSVHARTSRRTRRHPTCFVRVLWTRNLTPTTARRRRLPHALPLWISTDQCYLLTLCTLPRGRNQLCVPAVGAQVTHSLEAYQQLGRWRAPCVGHHARSPSLPRDDTAVREHPEDHRLTLTLRRVPQSGALAAGLLRASTSYRRALRGQAHVSAAEPCPRRPGRRPRGLAIPVRVVALGRARRAGPTVERLLLTIGPPLDWRIARRFSESPPNSGF